MAADDETTTAPPPQQPSPQGGLLDDPTLQRLIQSLTPQPVHVDTTPVERSWTSRLGEALGGGKGPVPLSPADEESAGRRSLMNFGIGLMGASRYQPGQTVFSNLAGGFQGAQRSMLGSEEMSASTLGAQQAYQQQQAQNKFEALKVALPMLMQSRMMNQPNPLAGNTTGTATVGRPDLSAPWSGNSYEGAIIGHEGTAPNPNSSAAGAGQFLASTWGDFAKANPDLFKGMTPQQILDARNNSALGAQAVTWLAKQNAPVLAANGATPSGQSLGIAHYIGAGPAAKLMAAPDNAPVSGFVSDAAVKANPELGKMTAGQLRQRYAGVPDPGFLAPAGGPKTAAAPSAAQPAATPPAAPVAQPTRETFVRGPDGSVQKVTMPQPPAPAVARPPIVTDQPAGGAVVAGPPGAASVGAPAPPGPNVAPDVNAIIRGMTGAGAQPTTLAPGASTQAPVAPPPTTVAANTPPPAPVATTTPNAPPTAQPGSQQPTDTRPDVELTQEDFLKRHFQPTTVAPITVDPATIQAQQAVVQNAQRNLAAATLDRSTATTLEARAAANKNYDQANNTLQAANAALATLQQGGQVETAKLQQKADEDQRAGLRTTYNQLLAQKAEADRLRQTGQQQIDLENVKTGNATSQKLQEAYNTDAVNSGKRIDDLELLRGLSDNAGTPTLLTNIKVGDRSLADIISATGFGGKDLQDKVGAVQAFRAGILNTVRELRSGGAATGEPRSNQDLQFVQDMAPNEWQQPATRGAIISFLQQVNQRRIDMAAEVARLTATRGTNGQLMPAGEAVAQARKNLPDFVQTVPAEAMGNTPTQVQARKEWFNTNVPPHTFFRYPNGRIDLYNGPGGQ